MSTSQYMSFLFTFVVLSTLMSMKVALVVMIGIAFHEGCHLMAAKSLGLKTKGFYLIPFVGGVALINDRYKRYSQQAFVVLMGPIGGGCLAAVTAAIYWYTGIQFIGAAAVWMTIVNLFNLVPASFLDGGQILDTITYTFNRTLGFACKAISTFLMTIWLFTLNPILAILITVTGGAGLWNEYNNLKNYKNGVYHKVDQDYLYPPKKLSTQDMALTIISYLAAAGLLIWLYVSLEHTGASIAFLTSKGK